MFYYSGLLFLCLTVGYVKTELVQGSCGVGYMQCEIGACLLDKYVCDGEIQCPDDTDEKYCSGNETTSETKDTTKLVQGNCPQGFVECEIGDICLEERYMCDGSFYCPDGSDEKFCEVKTTPKPTKTQLDRGICIDGYVECETGDICIQKKYVCDGHYYCPDKSDEKYCDRKASSTKNEDEPTTSSYNGAATTTNIVPTTQSSEEETNPDSEEKEQNFLLDDDVDHCKHYKRMIILVRRVHMRLGKMDGKTAKHIRHLINEILMEAGMENFSSLLELHHVCSNIEEGAKQPRRHHRHHTTTTPPTTT